MMCVVTTLFQTVSCYCLDTSLLHIGINMGHGQFDNETYTGRPCMFAGYCLESPVWFIAEHRALRLYGYDSLSVYCRVIIV